MTRREVNINTGNEVLISLTQEELDAAAITTAIENHPIKRWQELMAKSDIEDIPRWLEDHIESDHNGTTANIDLQLKYDNKKSKRASRPV